MGMLYEYSKEEQERLGLRAEKLEAALRDISLGTIMMQEPVLANSALKRYAAEVKRVSDAALAQS